MRSLLKVLTAIVVIVATSVTASAAAAANPVRGAVLADTCLGCHGIPGYRNAYPSYRVPKPGGQHEDYLQQAIARDQNGERKDPVMMGQVLNLSARDIEDVAAFYAAQKGLFTADYSD